MGQPHFLQVTDRVTPTRFRVHDLIRKASISLSEGSRCFGSAEKSLLRTEHGEAYEYDATVGPTVGHVLHFQTHGFKTRQNYSSLQLDGLGDSWGELAVPYLRGCQSVFQKYSTLLVFTALPV